MNNFLVKDYISIWYLSVYHSNLIGHPIYLWAASGSPRWSITCHYPYLERTTQSLSPTDGGVETSLSLVDKSTIISLK